MTISCPFWIYLSLTTFNQDNFHLNLLIACFHSFVFLYFITFFIIIADALRIKLASLLTRISNQVCKGGRILMLPFMSRMELTRRKGSWNLGVNMGEDSTWIVGYWGYYSGLFYLYLEFYYCAFVVVKITVIWSWKYCDYGWKFLLSWPFVHFITLSLSLMSSYYWNHLVLLEKLLCQLLSKEIRATSDIIRLD